MGACTGVWTFLLFYGVAHYHGTSITVYGYASGLNQNLHGHFDAGFVYFCTNASRRRDELFMAAGEIIQIKSRVSCVGIAVAE